MTRTITVKGIGTAKVKPDTIILGMTLDAKDRDYNRAVERASKKIEDLQEAIKDTGYEKSDLKTESFDVRADYDNRKDYNGNYQKVFSGYVCTYRVKLSFDFSNQRLGETLSAISHCYANPKLELCFTVKNPSEISEALLRSAVENARKKAEILCAASNVTLGDLLTIDYNWKEVTFLSDTTYDLTTFADLKDTVSIPEIEPEDIKTSDTATFVWEIS